MEGGLSFGVSTSQGIGLFYGLTESGAAGWSVNAFGGPGGDTYVLAKYLSTGETGAIGGVLALAKAVVDIGYSIVTRLSEVIAPKFRNTRREASEASLYSLRHSEDLSLAQCIDIVRSRLGDRLGSRYTPEEFKNVKQHAAQHLQDSLFVEMFKERATGEKTLKMQHWEQLLKICSRNSDLFSATLMSELRVHVDTLRLGEKATKAPGFMQGWGQNSRSGAARAAGAITSNMLSGLFNVQELSIGAPLNLRWHGWRVDKTIADTVSGWVENTFAFENTKSADRWWKKPLGAIMDVGGDILKIATRIVGTVLPVFFRSDARKEQVRKDVMKAIEQTEKSFSGKPDWEDKQLLANMLYLNKMLPTVFQGNDRALTKKISKHMAKYGVAYEVFASKLARAQAEQVKPTLQSLEKELLSLDGELAPMREAIMKGNKSISEEYKKKNSEFTEKSAKYNALYSIYLDVARRASEAYVYLSSVDAKEIRGLKAEVEGEIAGIREFFKADPKHLSSLDAAVEEMADTKKQSSRVLSSMSLVLEAMKKANGSYVAVLEMAGSDPELSGAIQTLESVKKHSLSSSVYRAYMAEAFAYSKSGFASQAQQSINSSLEAAIKQVDEITDAIKGGARYKQDVEPKLFDLYDQLKCLSDLAVFYPAEYSQNYRNKLDRELRWVMNKLPNKPLKKSLDKQNAAATRFELAYIIATSGVLSPEGQTAANKQMQSLGVDMAGSPYYDIFTQTRKKYQGSD